MKKDISQNERPGYAYYLFEAPLSKDISLLRRIGNLIFHILTLCIPFLIYRVISYCSSRQRLSDISRKIISDIDLDKAVKDIESLSGINIHLPLAIEGKRALLATKDLLEELSIESADNWYIDNYQIPAYMDRVRELYTKVYKELIDLLKQYPEKPWSQDKVLHAADKYMKVTFSFSILALNDIERIKADSDIDNFAIMTDKKRYIRFSYLPILKAYQAIRLGMYWRVIDADFDIGISESLYKQGGKIIIPNEVIIGEHNDAFYQEGSLQNIWRQLYNENVALIQDLMPNTCDDPSLTNEHTGILAWSQRDEDHYIISNNTFLQRLML